MDNNTLILIALALCAIYYFFFYNKEHLTDLTPEQQSFVDGLYNFINNGDVSYTDYLTYLNSVKNPYVNLVDNELFVGFKLEKKKGTFTKQNISNAM